MVRDVTRAGRMRVQSYRTGGGAATRVAVPASPGAGPTLSLPSVGARRSYWLARVGRLGFMRKRTVRPAPPPRSGLAIACATLAVTSPAGPAAARDSDAHGNGDWLDPPAPLEIAGRL